MKLRDLVAILRGDAGTTVKVSVAHGSTNDVKEVSLIRAALGPVFMDDVAPKVATPVVLPTNTAEALVVIAGELTKIRARLDALEPGEDEPMRFHTQHADQKRLNAVIFPEPPTRESLRNYIAEIEEASEGQNSYSESDRQVGMLARVGEENIDLLLEMSGHGAGQFHRTYAIKKLATSKSKDLILASLKTHVELAEIVLRNGWEVEARETLLAGLGSRYLPSEWIEGVVRLQDPTTYDRLLVHLVEGSNRSTTYELIRYLPGLQLEESVKKAWARARRDHVWERMGVAGMAVAYGVEEALETLIRGLQLRDVMRNEYLLDQVRTAIYEHSDCPSLSSVDAMTWYEAVKGHLVFDEKSRKFKRGVGN
jgi:hypothetical protein